MENIRFENVSFSYAVNDKTVLKNVSFDVRQGEFCLVIGKSGAGKSTLLKLIKKEIAPAGKLTGEIVTADNVGYVAQNVQESIVTDRVRSELSFGLTNMGVDANTVELSVAEAASYFNLSNKLDNDICSLSGGEKQILNLASVMIMKPSVLVLDEPTCQLDPVWAQRFLTVIKRLHRDFGTTVIISEHLLEELYEYADSVMLVEDGEIKAKLPSDEMTKFLKETDNPLLKSLPLRLRLFDGTKSIFECRSIIKSKSLPSICDDDKRDEKAMTVKNLCFAYKKNNYVLSELSLNIYKGKINAVLGPNSCGKSTFLKVCAGVLRAHTGKVKSTGKISMLCQNPYDLFTKDLCENEAQFGEITQFLEIDDIKNQHPYDISGGQAQRLALAKVLQTGADIILLDEPTKALDSEFKSKLAQKLKELCEQGKTVVFTTHDIDFAGEYADYISFMSGGEIVTTQKKHTFFSSLSYYTTAAARLCRGAAQGYVCEQDLEEVL